MSVGPFSCVLSVLVRRRNVLSERGGEPRPTAENAPRTKAALLDRAREYAREVVADYFPDADLGLEDVEWEVSTRAKRRAGATKYNRWTGEVAVSLTWAAYQRLGWEAMRETIRHELVHVWQLRTRGKAGHGPDFRAKAADLDASLHCERFAAPKWWLICESCGERTPRYRRSKTVTHPERYSCSCGGALRVERVEE